MSAVIFKVLSFAVIILAGVVASRSGRLGNGTDRVFSKVVFNVTLPAAIIHAFGSTSFDVSLLLLVPMGLLATGIPYVLSFVIGRKDETKDRVLQQMNVCGFNIGCFGLAFVQAFFPATCVVATCLFDAGNALMCTGSTYAITKTFVCKKPAEGGGAAREFCRTLFSSVPFDAYVLLIFLALLGIRVPDPVLTLLEPAANANAFLSMFMIGLMVRFSTGAAKIGKLAKLLIWRIAIAASLSVLMLYVSPFSLEVRQVLAVIAWAPIGSTGPVFTLWEGGDAGLAGLANAITVLMGIVVMTGLVLAFGVVS